MGEERLISGDDLQGALAYWAVVQHPFREPPSLFEMVRLVGRLFERDFPNGIQWFRSWPAVAEWLKRVLEADAWGKAVLVAWNTPRSGHDQPVLFTSRYGGPRPEDDFIDIDALLWNVGRMAWERNAEFTQEPKAAEA